MALKSALPTPTMMMDMGRKEAEMMASLVFSMSDMAPSVSINSTKYCWGKGRGRGGEGEGKGSGIWCKRGSHNYDNSLTG